MGSVDLPSEPEEPGGIEHGDAGDAEQAPKPHEMPDPDERGRVYEATRAYLEERAEPDRPRGGPDRQSYWNLVSRFLEMWADHERRWPLKPRPAADRQLSQERHTETAGAVDRTREAEPRISADVRAIERENKYGGWLEGFKFRLKGEDRLKEKIAEKLEAEPRMTASDALREVGDAIRFTYCFEPENYAKGYYDIKKRLESRGYETYYSQNSWTGSEYKGINTRWVTPDGQRFEVQFHTPESFHAKHHVTHDAYERIRNPVTSREELSELHAFQREVCSYIQAPDGAADIPNYRREGF